MELKGLYTLTKEQELNDNPKMIHKGDTITGHVKAGSLAIGRSVVVMSMTHWRMTSEIVTIREVEGNFTIETLNSIYTLKKYIPNEER